MDSSKQDGEQHDSSFSSAPPPQTRKKKHFQDGAHAASSTSTPPPTPPTPSSPRRRKTAQIDLDAALRLQSQAASVQEPAKRAIGLLAGGTHQVARASNSPSQSSATTSTCNNSQQRQSYQHVNYYDANYATAAAAAPANGSQQQQQQRATCYATNAISVDYIDCLSNNDLAGAVDMGSGAMKGIPLCRKHLSRFHRSHKVEPTAQQPQASGGDSSTTTEGSINSSQNEVLQQQQQQPQASTSSVLYPISVSEAKKRTYFIGSLGQASLLSQDELYRYFPTGRVSIFVCTWNQNRKRAPANLMDLLLPDALIYMPDIYAVGIQEAFSSQADYLRDWEVELQTTLGPTHVLLHSCSLGVLHLSLFIRRDLIWFCSTPEESLYASRSMPANMTRTKGAISIAFRFFGTSFMFTNCHFPAHEHRVRDRVEEYQRIISSIDLPKNLKALKPRYLSVDSTARFDCCFFLGDLNFRLEQRTFDETIQILDDILHSPEPDSFEALTQHDELLRVMEQSQAFHGFDESQIRFPPTYKFLAQTNKYDRQTKRVPSYTDRILFRSKRQRHIQCLAYDWLPQLLSSDHKPVYCLFDVLIRPGHEQSAGLVGSLNAGLFQRAVYLEALKRRAEDPDGLRENGASGNLICSIS